MKFGCALSAAVVVVSCSAEGGIIVPDGRNDEPVFGVDGGVLVGLPSASFDDRPDGGPRGLLRIGVEHGGERHLLNYIAIEPIVGGARGLSELERSADGQPGKLLELVPPPRGRARGSVPWLIERDDRGRSVRFAVRSERFENGARPIVEVTIWEDLPHQIRFREFAADGSAPMASLVLTATMGNQARCRELWLRGGVVTAREIFDRFGRDGFAHCAPFPIGSLHRRQDGSVFASISPDEYEPSETLPFPDGAWRHTLPWVAQSWRKPAGEFSGDLVVRVNGRRQYWGGKNPIPGGVSFENFEMVDGFKAGRETWFGFTFEDPARSMGYSYSRPPWDGVTREIGDREVKAQHEALRTGRSLVNGDFEGGLEGWELEGRAESVRVFERDGEKRLTTFGGAGDRDTVRIWQCFVVGRDAAQLKLFVHGGSDPDRTCVRLWRGETLWRWTTARGDNVPFEVRWDLRPLHGEVVTIEVVDASESPWGFIGIHGVEPVRLSERELLERGR